MKGARLLPGPGAEWEHREFAHQLDAIAALTARAVFLEAF
jgi:hypothetical protein